ncbi:MAG: Ig-like domain-containing protein [Acidobacteria bacterium]|nr:Ig-like domain-containing protein [Acidobacteriota bacterium]
MTILNSAPTATGVSITGTQTVGQVLTGAYTYGDVDGDAEGVSTFRWLRNGATVVGTSGTYTLVAADAGQTITFEVTPVAATGTSPGAPATSSGATILNSAPTATGVGITGTLTVGQVLTGVYTYGDVDGDLEGVSTFRWLRNGTTVVGTSSTYTIVAADSGQAITFEVTPVAATGTSPGAPATSGAATILNSAPTATGVSITGTLTVGQVLTGQYTFGDLDSDTEGASTFRWLRNGTTVVGTTGTYTLVAADAGQTITFEVTPVASTGTSPGAPATSSGVTILNSAPTATGVSITGTLTVGQVLTGQYTYGDVDSDTEGASTFRWLRGGSTVVGTSSTYTLVAADAGQTITFEVTPVAATGTSPGAPATSSGVTILNSAPTATGVSITGTQTVGQVLTGAYTYGDVDGDAEGVSTFRWLRNGATVVGTSGTYTLVAADAGQTITFEVTPVAATGTSPGAPATSSGATILNSAPTATGVSITGTLTVGQVLTGVYTYGDVDGDAEGASTFRWLRNGTTVVGTNATYTLVAADAGQTITFEVTPVAATGTSPGAPATSSGATILNSAPTATGVSITGTLTVGQVLTGVYTYGDVDGDLEGVSTFRWLRNGTTVVGTGGTYTLVAADAGQAITFEVTPVAATGTSPGAPATSGAATVLNSAPTATGVSITGTLTVGQVLAGVYTYGDVDGDAEGVSTFRWLRNGTTVVGTSATYTLVAADAGQTITFEVTPVAATGTLPGTPATSGAATILNSAPTATGVSITGTLTVGQVLTGVYTYGDVDGDAEGASTFRWLRNGTTVVGTSSTYTIVAADSGQAITFEVTPVAATGTSPGAPATSGAATILNSAPTATGVSITGTLTVGQVLTGAYTYGDVDGDAEGTSTFRWLRNGTTVVGTNATYTLVAADAGQAITFEVTPVAATGTSPGAPATSGAATILNSAPTATGVGITGTLTVGQVLTGQYTYGDVDSDAEGTSTFRWLRGGSTVVGTSSTYTLVAADAGQTITFEVTPVAATGTSPGAPATSAGVTILNSAPTATSVSITGTLTVGQVLTGQYTYGDVDGDLEGTSTFRWLRNGSTVVGTSSTYTLVAGDAGQTITFEVTPVAATGTSPGAPATSGGVTILNSAPTATGVSITGTLTVGQLLTGQYTYGDVDSDLEGTSTFRWLRNGSTVVGTSSTYTLVAADAGQTITFEVTPVAATGTSPGVAATSGGVTILNSAPTATSVSITGTLTVGQVLTGQYTYGDVDSDAEGTSTFRWLRGGSTVVGTASTYTLVAADAGQTITFEVTPVAATGTSPGVAATSSGVTILNSAPTATGVSITGTLTVGQVLTGQYTYGDVDADLEGVSTFRWLRNGTTSVGTSSTYTLVAADAGQTITFEVTPVAATGTSPGVPATSAGVTILNSAPTATSVGITGTLTVGQVLTGQYTYGDVDSDTEGASTFRWLRNGTTVVGTTGTYTLGAADAGQSITFEVTPVAATGTSPGTPATSAGVTILNSAPTATGVSITGTLTVGQVLTGQYTYGDLDSDSEGTSTFRWLRGGSTVVGTSSTYTMVAADAGQTITFEVTPVAATGTSPGSPATSSGVTILNSAPTATSVSITGTVTVGQLLTGQYTYGDVDADLEWVSTFRWLRNGSTVVGTSSTYTLVAADAGQTITFEVTPAAATGTSPGVPATSAGVTILNSAPTATSVGITGTLTVGQVLTGQYTYGDVDSDTEGASTFRWLRNGTTVVGTNGTYTLVAADAGQTITFEVTPVAATGTSPGAPATSGGVTILNSAPTATGVGITGTLTVGQVLTGQYTYGDVDSDAEGTSTFRWLRNGSTVVGTSSTYTLVAGDAGQTITFEVTPVAATGTSPGAPATSSGATILNSAPTATGVSITGTLTVGQVLTGQYTYGDVDADLEGASAFRWLRNGTTVVGTGGTYTLVAADAGQTITFEVTPVAATGTSPGAPATSSGATILNSAPTATSVSITGTLTVGQVLTGAYSYGDVDGDAEGVSTFRWLRNGTTVVGTNATYTLVAADSGQTITFEVTPVAATGTSPGAPATSSGVTILNSAPTATGVSITGTLTVGQVLTGAYTYGDVDGDLEGASTFRWLRNGTTVVGTSGTYTLVAADAGQAITFEVTPVAATGTSPGTPATSGAATILNSAPTATSVSITGTLTVGQLLTGQYTYGDVDGDLEGVSTFRWLRGGSTVVGTGSTYTLVAADSGQTITFQVTPVAATGTSPGAPATSAGVSIGGGAPTLLSIDVTPRYASMLKGATMQFAAMGRYSDGSTQDITLSVTWSSSRESVATIDNTGRASGVGIGLANIKAKLGAISDSTLLFVWPPTLVSVTVTPTNPSIRSGASEQFRATGTYSDGSTRNITRDVTWSSSNTSVARINRDGRATGDRTGTTTIKAASGGISDSTVLTVTRR